MTSPRCLLVGLFTLALTGIGGCGEDRGGDPAGADAGPSLPPVHAPFETFEEACAAIPGCEGRAEAPPAEPILQVVIEHAPGAPPQILAIAPLTVDADIGVPSGPADGELLVVGLDATGAPLDGQWLRVPTTTLGENFGGLEVDPYVEELELEGPAVLVGYVRARPELDAVALLGADGALLAAPTPLPPFEKRTGQRNDGLAASDRDACRHIHLIEGEGERSLMTQLVDAGNISLEVPGPTQRAVIRAALNRVTPELCGAVTRIALVDFPSRPGTRGLVSGYAGDIVYLNVAYQSNAPDSPTMYTRYGEASLARDPLARAEFARLLVHEMGHAFVFLNGADRARAPDEGEWYRDARAAAKTRARFTRTGSEFGVQWRLTHESFVKMDLAGEYSGTKAGSRALETRRVEPPERIPELGAMSHYGSTAVGDDISEFIAWTVTRGLFEAAGVDPLRGYREDFACASLRAYAEGGLPRRFAAVYTKIWTLVDAGAISEADALDCIGPGITAGDGPPGAVFFVDDAPVRWFTRAPALQQDTDGTYVFRAEGSVDFGEQSYSATFYIFLARLDPWQPALLRYSWPRGIHSLTAEAVVPGVPLQTSSVYIHVPDEPAASLLSLDGEAVLYRANNALRAGSIILREALRPDAPVPVPQVFDPPLVIRFVDNDRAQ